jgi:holo-[acyl-carrier protein] synthase
VVLGYGVDIVDARRIRRVLQRFGARFIGRIYSESERAYCMARKRPELHLAARFGAKEAFIKAIGTRRGIRWKDIEVAGKGGPPTLLLHGNAKKLADDKGVKNIHLTLAHDAELGIAGVILEGRPDHV